jgi:quercetin dioxygenase-like cupin family protein
MDAYYAEFPPSSKTSEPHQHKGSELNYVLKGRLVVDVDGEQVTLDEGDAMHFASSAPHTYRGEGRMVTSAIVVVSP